MTKSNFDIAKQLTSKMNVSTSNKKSNLDYFHEILYNNEISRQDIIIQVNLKKLEDKVDNFDLKNDEHIKMFQDNYTKSKNMVDTSISNSNNNSSYSFNKKFEQYELIKLDNGNYIIKDKVEDKVKTKK